MGQPDRFSSYRYGEGRTGIGQAVEFTCPPSVADQVKEFLQANVRTIHIPTTGLANVSHGGFGQYTRYDITQHKYAGGGPGYIEVLEVKNPPDGRWGIVINEYLRHKGSAFTEWETLRHARAAYEKYWGSSNTEKELPKLKGFKRRVVCGLLTPWFYAIGDEQLIGDYAFPDGLQDDPVFRFGQQFVVTDYEGNTALKTCMGTRFIEADDYPYKKKPYRLVYWNDGSVWDESRVCNNSPRPVEEGEMWIAEAVEQFRKLLTGKSTGFTINFTDGNKFTGKLTRANHRAFCMEGNYLLTVQVKGEEKPRVGWVDDFKPSPEAPDVVEYVTGRLAQKGHEVEKVEITERKTAKGGKKWAGVFFRPPTDAK